MSSQRLTACHYLDTGQRDWRIPNRRELRSVLSRQTRLLAEHTPSSSGKVISCAGSGQDGEWRFGVAWPEPRFEILRTV